jgi:hypothetical protein
MAAISVTSKNVAGPFNATLTTLTSSDTMTYTPNVGQELFLWNPTGSPVVVTVDGAGGTTVPVPDAGAATFSVASGLAITVPANGVSITKLDTVKAYLKGAIAVTGGTGVLAAILQ